MKADRVEPKQREAWVAKQVEEGIDVLICHPRLVQTGLDLIQFPTIVWYETDYSVYTMRQASRRSWRIGQTRPVKVVFMAYRSTLQADALKLVAQKLQSSLAVEGELPEDGLAAYGDTGDDLMMALARKLVSGDAEDEPVEDIFRQAQEIAAQADQLLVDDGWHAVEPVPQPVALASGGDLSAEPDAQQSLFSWAEFLTEPEEQPTRGGRRAGQTGPSLFDWALEREQQGAFDRRRRRLTARSREASVHRAPASPCASHLPTRTHHEGEHPMARIFVYDDREFPDPDPAMTVDQVKATLSDFFGEIANSSVTETPRGARHNLRVPAPGRHQGRPVARRAQTGGGAGPGVAGRAADRRPAHPAADRRAPGGTRAARRLARPRRGRRPADRGRAGLHGSAGIRPLDQADAGGAAMPAAAPPLLSAVAAALLQSPPALVELVAQVRFADDYAWFAGLVQRLFPEQAEETLSALPAAERVERFVRLFEERHFPLYTPFDDFWAEALR